MERDLHIERTQAGASQGEDRRQGTGPAVKDQRGARAQIRTDYEAGLSMSELAKRFAVSRATILSIGRP